MAPHPTAKNKIIPHLWFDKEAVEAARFYASVFPQSAVHHVTKIRNTPSGDCDVVVFDVWGHRFQGISAGPFFKPNPSISFFVNFHPAAFGSSGEAGARAALDAAWAKLSDGGTALMPLDSYFFSKRYGWIQDRYGFSWQLMLPDPAYDARPAIVPSLMFVGANAGRAEEAIRFYLAIFRNAKMGNAHRYGPGAAPDKEGTVMYADFALENTWFAAMDSAHDHHFGFNEAVSLMVSCASQTEIDGYWGKLSAVPEAEQCGWLKDRFGVSWQIVPRAMEQMMTEGTPAQIDRVTQAFLPMKKFDLAALERAFR